MTLKIDETPSVTLAAWYQKEADIVLNQLATNTSEGLTTGEARERLVKYGPNELVERGRRHPAFILWEQFTSTMVLILIAAAVISGFLGKITETLAISAIVVLFAVLGFVQEYRAERAMAALKQLAVPLVRVRRNGDLIELPARDVVPGDIIVLEAGNLLPADVRLVESINLRIQEAALTGESEPVEKETAALDRPNLPLGDRRNMGYMGTVVTYGRGTGVVVETGMETELGKIANLIQAVPPEITPLQRQLDTVGKTLAGLGVVVAGIIMVIGLLSGQPLSQMFLTAVSVAVAVVPEGLPAVVTVTLALGAQRMLRRKALIRKLPAVETLGSITVICSDKTGTLTENRMTVTVIDVAGQYLELGEGLRHPAPALAPEDDSSALINWQSSGIGLVLVGGTLCNDASLRPDPQTGRFQTVGDPTEGALLVAASQMGLTRSRLQNILPRAAELPFDADRKRMTTVHPLPADHRQLPTPVQQSLLQTSAPYLAITKGSVDGLLEICDQVWVQDHGEPLTEPWRQRVQVANDQMAQNGMRVLGLAWRWLDQIPTRSALNELEQGLIFVGMVGIIDPPRPEVKLAVQTCQTAGIRPVMITGDHPLTARFIAHDLGIADGGRVITGQELNKMTAADLLDVVETVSVYARVSPEHKLRIVEALQQRGQVVAMTGDGVNDSPALKKADIGVAMGLTGTDVSKEAAQMVLLDDNFATIVTAIEEGRVIYDNIRRFIKFSIAGNIGKVTVMLFAPLLGIAVALQPLQLLWLNLLTDGLLGLGLGVEPPEHDTMRHPPRSPKAGFLSGGLGRDIGWVGLLVGAIGLGLGYLYYDPTNPADTTWQTMIFTTLAFLQIGQALASRSTQTSLFGLGLRSNPLMTVMVLITLGLQLLAIYAPFLRDFFRVTPLSGLDLTVSLVCGSLVFIAIEGQKWMTATNLVHKENNA